MIDLGRVVASSTALQVKCVGANHDDEVEVEGEESDEEEDRADREQVDDHDDRADEQQGEHCQLHVHPDHHHLAGFLMDPDEEHESHQQTEERHHPGEVESAGHVSRDLSSRQEFGDEIVEASDQVEDADDDGASAEGAAAAAGAHVEFVLRHFLFVVSPSFLSNMYGECK